ncbi:MAG: tetratricopeptide repeat protein, partial [Candidatus Aminicenantes bacterium]|nr:tetratricopeptide repeat protein [Candidatus Aminicenantes bacterium]
INKTLEINEAVNNLWGIAATKGTKGMVYYWHGKIDLAYQTSNEALQIAEESGDIYSKGISYTAYGISCYAKGYFEEAVRYLLRGAQFCERINFPSWHSIARYYLGDAYFDMGEYQESQNYCNEAITISEQARFLPSFLNICKIASEKAKARNNEKDIDLESVFQCHEENRSRLFDGWMARYTADILLNIDDRRVNEAEHWIKKAIAADTNNNMRWHLGRDYALYGELFKRKENQPKVRENLGKAIEIMTECGADGWVEKYEKELEPLT